MATTNMERGADRGIAIARASEAAFGAGVMDANAARIYVPAALGGQMMAHPNMLSDREWANGEELEYDRIPMEKTIGANYTGFWTSVGMVGRSLGFGVGNDTLTVPSGTIYQHVFNNDVDGPDGFTMAETGPQAHEVTTAKMYEGNQLNSWGLTIGQRGWSMINWNVVGTDIHANTYDVSSDSYESLATHISNSKISVFIASAGTEHTSTWASTYTQPTTATAPTANDIVGTNVSPQIVSLSLNYNNNLDIDGSYGAGTATGAHITRGQAYWTGREITGSITFFQKVTASATVLDSMITNLYAQTEANQTQYTLQIIGTTDTDLGTSKYSGFTLIVPIMVIDPESWTRTNTMGPQQHTVNFHAQKSTNIANTFYGAVWDGTNAVYGTAA
jgi:hypothetical protein